MALPVESYSRLGHLHYLRIIHGILGSTMPFDPTNFVNNQQPAITAAQLNKLGTQYDAVAADVGDPGTEVGAELANAFVRFVDQDGNPLPAGSLTTIVVNTITNDIDDIIFEESS